MKKSAKNTIKGLLEAKREEYHKMLQETSMDGAARILSARISDITAALEELDTPQADPCLLLQERDLMSREIDLLVRECKSLAKLAKELALLLIRQTSDPQSNAEVEEIVELIDATAALHDEPEDEPEDEPAIG